MATFTKKHYREIAKVLSKAKLKNDSESMPYMAVDQWLEIRDNFIDLFEIDNFLFDKELFKSLCKGGEVKC